MASKEKQTIVVDRVHSNVKVLGNSHQKPEADMCRQLSIVSQDAVENRSGACRKISYDELDT